MADNPDITPEMTKTLAARAWFVFTVNLMDRLGIEGTEGNDFDLAGEGVEIFDTILTAMTNYHKGRFQLDYGGLIQDVREVGPGNVQSLKDAYIAIYGNVNRPDVWNTRDSGFPRDPSGLLTP